MVSRSRRILLDFISATSSGAIAWLSKSVKLPPPSHHVVLRRLFCAATQPRPHRRNRPECTQLPAGTDPLRRAGFGLNRHPCTCTRRYPSRQHDGGHMRARRTEYSNRSLQLIAIWRVVPVEWFGVWLDALKHERVTDHTDARMQCAGPVSAAAVADLSSRGIRRGTVGSRTC
jgi:hypothetical protein